MKKIIIGFTLFLLSSVGFYWLWFEYETRVLTLNKSIIFIPLIAVLFFSFLLILQTLFQKNLKTLQINFIIFWVLIFFMEVALRFFGFFDNYQEKNFHGTFSSVYATPFFDEWGYHRNPNASFTYFNGEFDYVRKCNEWGYTNRPIPIPKPTKELRFFVFGDSFCEGAGVSFYDAVPQLLEKHFSLFSDSIDVKFYNLGMSGSDIVFAYHLLQKLKNYQPDGIVFMQNSTDVNDIMVRGGLERFSDNNKLKYKPAPSWEFLYAVSHVNRAIVHRLLGFNFSLIQNNQLPELEKNVLNTMTNIYQKILDEYPKVWVFSYPQLEDFDKPDFQIESFGQWVDENGFVTDLSEDIKSSAREKNLAIKDIYWPIDRHFNEIGYQLLAESLAKSIAPDVQSLIQQKQTETSLN